MMYFVSLIGQNEIHFNILSCPYLFADNSFLVGFFISLFFLIFNFCYVLSWIRTWLFYFFTFLKVLDIFWFACWRRLNFGRKVLVGKRNILRFPKFVYIGISDNVYQIVQCVFVLKVLKGRFGLSFPLLHIDCIIFVLELRYFFMVLLLFFIIGLWLRIEGY